MKFLTIISLCFALISFDCSSKKDKAKNRETTKSQKEKNMSGFLSYENTEDGIEYKFAAELKKAGSYNGIEYKNDFVEVTYELNNTNEKDYIVFNQGHFGTNSHTVYVEPKKDGTVEVSQKAFEEPTDRNCPQRFVAITPNASWLRSNQKVAEKVQVEMPLETRTPYDDCEPKPELPKEIKDVKFCIGVMQADAEKIKLNDNGNIRGMISILDQRLLCSDTVKLK